jgi:GT2 family glycosyltransferase
VRADAFADVGGFDPPMAPAEDADWCWRATARGWRIQYVKEARVTHHHRATLGGMIRQAYGYGLGNAALFAKHRDQFGAKVWIDPRFAGWAMKGLIKTPWCWATGRDPLQRRLAWYDFLSNAAQAWGRVRGGAHKRRLTD